MGLQWWHLGQTFLRVSFSASLEVGRPYGFCGDGTNDALFLQVVSGALKKAHEIHVQKLQWHPSPYITNFLNGYQKSTVMVGKPPHHGSTGPQPRCFTSARFIRRFTWIPGARNFCLGASPMVCFSDIRGSEHPTFFLRIWWYCICCWFFPGIYEVFFKKNWCLECILTQHTNTCSTPLPGFDSLRPNSQKKKHWRWWSSSPTCGTRNFQAPGVFLFGRLYCCQAQNFWFEGKMWRVYWSLLIIRFTGQGWVMPHPQKEKNNHFLDIHSSILPKQNEKTASGVSGFLWFSGNQGNFQR